MKNKKIICTAILFLLIIIMGTLNVNATQEINTFEEITKVFGSENIEINDNQIKLLNDIKLRDSLIINSGNYVIDLNGKTISYTKNYNTAIYIQGGNFTIIDETNNGKIVSKGTTLYCNNGLLKIENCKLESKVYGISLGVASNGLVQIDNGEFMDLVQISSGTLIINNGLFREGLDVSFEEFSDKLPNVTINGGEFIGNNAGLYIWFSNYAKNVKLKGGTFKGCDKDVPAIYVGGNGFDLNNLLSSGYRYVKNGNQVSVERYTSRNTFKLIFVDYEGNILLERAVVQGKISSLPTAPKKENYVFVNWNINANEINHDAVITPNYNRIYNFKVDVIYDEYFTGEEIKPTIVIIDENTKTRLSEDDYELSCENNKNVGTASVTIQGKGKYKYCSKTAEFKILQKTINYDFELITEKEFEYTGNEIKPNVKLMYKNTELINGVDYKVEYTSNVNAGYGRITVSGIGNYTGEKTEIFRIKQKQISEVTLNTTNVVYTGNKITPEITVRAGNIVLKENADYTVYYNNNVNIGTATVRVVGQGNYEGNITKEFNIISKDIKNAELKIDLSNKTYTGRYLKPDIVLKDNAYTLKENYDYTVEYSNNMQIGTATVKITGKNGYTGTIIRTFKIVPKAVRIKTLKASLLRTVNLTWQKDTSVDGYEIYRSNSKNGGFSLIKTIDNKNKDNYLFLAQKKGKYYYEIRSYKTVNGIRVYSDFSDVKEVKVK